MKVFLTCVSGLFVATIGVCQFTTQIPFIPFATFACFVAGAMSTYAFVVATHTLLSWVGYIRAINSIRKHFVQMDERSAHAFLLPTDTKRPRVNGLSVHCMMCSALSAGFYGLAVFLFIVSFDSSGWTRAVASIAGVCIGGFVLILNWFVFKKIGGNRKWRGTRRSPVTQTMPK